MEGFCSSMAHDPTSLPFQASPFGEKPPPTNQCDVFRQQKHQGDFMPSSQLPYWDRTVSPPNPEELQLLQIRMEGPFEPPSWCCCGKCRPADAVWERLCCRKTDGPCITASPLFVQLVLSEPMLKFVLLYKDPLLDVTDAGRKPFRHCAYEQYIRWRFGEGDLGARAVIPNCCRWRIRDAFPSENGRYRGYEEQFGMAAPLLLNP